MNSTKKSASSASANSRPKARVEIVEQPAGKALRFRYECEGRSADSIPGVNSTPENKTYPTIRILGFKGKAIVAVSCVTKDEPYRPHPHKLVGKDYLCQNGACLVQISDDMTYSFTNLGIQCVKKKDIAESLNVRGPHLDPFKTGLNPKRQPTSIDLNAVRLCFQVFLESATKEGTKRYPLAPVVSDPIYDQKTRSDPEIWSLSHCTATAAGGSQILLLGKNINQHDIEVRFFIGPENNPIWEGFGEFRPNDVHKKVAITFRTPGYMDKHIEEPVRVAIQLRRPSDGATSKALPFEIFPIDPDDTYSLKLKRIRINNNNLMKMLQEHFNTAGDKHCAAQYNRQYDRHSPQPPFNPMSGNVGPRTAGHRNVRAQNQSSKRTTPQTDHPSNNVQLLDAPIPPNLREPLVRENYPSSTFHPLIDTSDEGAVGGETNELVNILNVHVEQFNNLDESQAVMSQSVFSDLQDLNL